MSSIKPVSHNFFAWGYDKLAQAADYVWRTAKAVVNIAQNTLNYTKQGEQAWAACSKAMEACPAFKRSRTLKDGVSEAERGVAQPIHTETYFEMGLYPKTKRVHYVNDPKLAEELLNGTYAKRGDFLLDFGFKEEVGADTGEENMLLSSYKEHRRLRCPLEQTFSKRSAQNGETLRTLAQTATGIFVQQVRRRSRQDVIEPFVFSTLVRQVLGMEVSQEEEKQMVDLLSNTDVKSTEVRRQLEAVISRVLQEKHYRTGGGMHAIAGADLLSASEKMSTTLLIYSAGMHTTIEFLKCFLEILASTQYNDKINEEWETFREGRRLQSADELSSSVAEFVQKSDLLNSCYLEAMRLFPIIPMIKRLAKKNFMLGHTRIYAGDEIQINVMAAQRDARAWKEPALFNPERFKGALENPERKPNLLNFGLGSQSCIGKHYLESEAKIMGALFCIVLENGWINHSLSTSTYTYNDFNLSIPKMDRQPVTEEFYAVRADLRPLIYSNN